MIKRFRPIFFLVLFFMVFSPVFVFAGHYKAFTEIDKDGHGIGDATTIYYKGIVPCGKKVFICRSWDESKPTEVEKCESSEGYYLTKEPVQCQLCHSFIMIDGIIDYILIDIIPYVTVLMIVVGGIMFYFGGTNPNLLSRSKTLFKGIAIGLVLIYGAYMIVGFFLDILGAADVNPIKQVFDANNGVFKINCPVKIPASLLEP